MYKWIFHDDELLTAHYVLVFVADIQVKVSSTLIFILEKSNSVLSALSTSISYESVLAVDEHSLDLCLSVLTYEIFHFNTSTNSLAL